MRKVLSFSFLVGLFLLGLTSLVQAGADKVAVCHSLGNGGWQEVNVDRDAWDEHTSGHSDHPNDFLVDNFHPCPPEFATVEPTEEVTATPDPEETETPVVTETPGPEETETPVVTETPDPEETQTPDPEETETPRPHNNVPSVVVLPGLDQITFWSNLPLSGVGIVVGSDEGGWSIVTDENLNPLIFTVGGTPAIEFRNRWNASIQAYEENVPMVRLTLGRDNADINPDHYRSYDWATYQATGQVVLVNVWTEYQDEHCQVEDFGSGAVCGTSVNWTTGERWENGVRVR
jgi:hypothetical protein